MEMYQTDNEEQLELLSQLKSKYGTTITWTEFLDSDIICKPGLIYDYIYGQLRFFSINSSGFSCIDGTGRRVLFRPTRLHKFYTDHFRFEPGVSWEEYADSFGGEL